MESKNITNDQILELKNKIYRANVELKFFEKIIYHLFSLNFILKIYNFLYRSEYGKNVNEFYVCIRDVKREYKKDVKKEGIDYCEKFSILKDIMGEFEDLIKKYRNLCKEKFVDRDALPDISKVDCKDVTHSLPARLCIFKLMNFMEKELDRVEKSIRKNV